MRLTPVSWGDAPPGIPPPPARPPARPDVCKLEVTATRKKNSAFRARAPSLLALRASLISLTLSSRAPDAPTITHNRRNRPSLVRVL